MSAFAGARPLLEVSARQDARAVVPWIAGISALSASSVLAYAWIFPDREDRTALAQALGGNPALSLIFGPARDLLTADGFNAWRAGGLGAFFAALMAVLVVVRNSRAAEDSGQAELLASGVMGRQARLGVAVTLGATASVALGIVSFLITVACGGGAAATGILCATFACAGLMFTGVGAVTAQISSDARTATSMGVATAGVLYVLRGYLDSSGAPRWTDWATPFGWLEATRPATENRPWPLLPAVALALLLVAAAFALQERRDFGQGAVATRPGPARGRGVTSPWGLAVRLHRGALAAWLVAFAALGVVFGNLASSIGDVLAANPAIADTLARGATGDRAAALGFIVTILQLTGIIAAVLGVQVALRIRAEEVAGRVEPLLAGSLRRQVYLASNLVVGLAGSALAMVTTGITLGLAGPRDDVSARDVVEQAAATVPAVWLLVAIAFAAVGGAPRVRLIGWVGVVASFGLTILGPTFKLPDWALDISPFRHVPAVTGPSPDWSGLAWLCAVTLVLLTAAFAGFRRRDVL
ncbi:ABC transporter permease [Aeromicrobium chenweiae]|uniref:Multidrug ABC transporter permease n=1 Tax=Aeromicrobium chenweiae TaxID=2079793 RepID=A0A2S0WML3_9ACTN|nr:multidrug ABC transporter permease [Aeromicrobium chenweiae]AWB92589.1 multidrug ABC transporter permease [Aeromicrobium chenweiae]TGN33576.1 multidrug ABC transporter permease [Aeromicrobium chenweiae]